MEIDPRNIEVIDDQMADVFRKMTGAERLRIMFGFWRSARAMMQSYLRGQHPDWTADEVEHEVARRMSHGAV